MASRFSKLTDWTPEQIAMGKRWVQAWKEAGPELERLRRQELRRLDVARTIAPVRPRGLHRSTQGS